jgi:hypothetical protein
MQKLSFSALSSELTRLSNQFMNREGDPRAIANEAVSYLIANQDHVVAEAKQNLEAVPKFARACATLIREPLGQTTEMQLAAILDAYTANGSDDVNDSAAVLSAACVFWQRTTNPTSVFPSITRAAFQRTLSQWSMDKKKTRTDSIITMLSACNALHGEALTCEPLGEGKMSLLPVKSKLQMEAKLLRLPHARHLLEHLREVSYSRVDAGVCLNTMASSGLYDQAVADTCCAVLHGACPLLSSQQLSQIIFNLGVLQHRHVHQQFFANKIVVAKCTRDALRRVVQGQAMLQMPVTNPKALMDGVFLHALRPSHSSGLPEIHFSWFTDIGFALHMLGLRHHKFMMHTARTVRCDLHKMSQPDLLRLMFALGGEDAANVPQEMRVSWPAKVGKVLAIASMKLEAGVPLQMGPLTVQALRHCGIKDHPMIPNIGTAKSAAADDASGFNPVDVLLKTWRGAPSGHVLNLVGQIEHQHFTRPSSQISDVLEVLAQDTGNADGTLSQSDHYKLSTLCDCVELHVLDMPLGAAVRTLRSLVRIGAGDRYESACRALLNKLWNNRQDLDAAVQLELCQVLERIGARVPLAMELLEFISSQESVGPQDDVLV